MREWLPVLADALGAKPPRHFPVWLARRIAGEAAVMMGTEPAAPPARRPSASSAGRRATAVGGKGQGFAEVYAKPIASTATQIPTPASAYPA
jgi:hypothetical protein